MNSLKNIITADKRKGIVGAGLAGIVFAVCAVFFEWQKGLMFAILFLIAGFVKINLEKPKYRYFINFFWVFELAVATCYSGFIMVAKISRCEVTAGKAMMNILCVIIIYALLFLIIARWKASVIVSSFLLLVLSTVNSFVFQFRGKELVPMDFLSLETAINVSSQYKPEISSGMAYGWILWLLFVFVLFSLPKLPEFSKMRARTVSAAALVTSLLSLQLVSTDIPIKSWYEQGTLKNGYYLNFFLALRDSVVKKPENYSPQSVQEYVEGLLANAEETQKSLPNIIVIMNESYADFNVLGENLHTNQPITPFMDSLEENTIRGYALSSVYGANTANSEFEFLTGHSMAFLPENSVPYQQYINNEIFTMAWLMRSFGYTSNSTHPYWYNGWSRDKLYPLFGFEESTFFDSYPNENVIRKYISDQEMFEYVMQNLKEKEDGKPLFLFGITMQNHGGYTYKGEDFVQTIELEGYSSEYPKAEQYFSLIHETDKAMEYLINELENYEEDTVVLFFGDHFPKVETAFYEEVHGGAYETLSEQMLQYKVPFMVWANYDIEEQNVECTSLNYLSRYLLEAAGLELPSYHSFLKDMEEVVPAMNSLGYYSVSQNDFISYDAAEGEEAAWLNQYEALQYNNLFDEENRDEMLFGQYIPSGVSEE